MSSLGSSELILNPDGSIYHLNLLPEDIAETIITVGDPERVHEVSKYFDSIEIRKGKREFLTHTGHLSRKRLTVISTGIGTDNIDIVLNELDALANIDFPSRQVKNKKKQLGIIRIGTSGTIRPEIPIDSFLMSTSAIGLDGLLHFYEDSSHRNRAMEKALIKHLDWGGHHIVPYVVDSDAHLRKVFVSPDVYSGITVTNSGFYGPQGRILRLAPKVSDFQDKLASFSFEGQQITNLEMETAGIYGLAKLMGHKAVSLNAILANRATAEFSTDGGKTIDSLIKFALERLVNDPSV
ncbi:uridine phosphorylase [Flagellimonas taeanensis]|uniref:Uridine phosphorylase n=1 Tax=Flagellimonas taeanensis TaxID=1005926 RepID=A0A1M6ZS78_9FLAO|nr:nucleoside phosphorylase [Allomuricauda taeanensis]SFC29159.1 uridine phosphorylase [Allomuricauda taeanensis]SHL33185.1 uridine phosphorylase [Allomuricauda taeanensis]